MMQPSSPGVDSESPRQGLAEQSLPAVQNPVDSGSGGGGNSAAAPGSLIQHAENGRPLPSAMIETTNLAAFAEWFKQDVTRRYFFEDDPVSKRVLEAILSARVLPEYIVPDESIRIPSISPDVAPMERFHAICQSIFVMYPTASLAAGGDASQPEQLSIAGNIVQVCEAAKNAMRIERHRHIHQALKKKLQDAIAEATRRHVDDADDHGNTEGLAATAFRQLRDFGTRYRTVLGARPFIKGIRRLLTEQLASPNLLCWHVHEASFTEVSDDFIEDAVRLLVNTMHLGSHFDSETAESLYHWTLPVWTSDGLLRRMLASLPPDDLGVRASGTVTETEVPRQNPPEGPRGLRAYCARFCQIL